MPSRFKGCVFFNTSTPELTKIRTISMEWENISIPFWDMSSSQDFLKTIKGSNVTVKETEHKTDYLSGRYIIDRSVQGGNRSIQRL